MIQSAYAVKVRSPYDPRKHSTEANRRRSHVRVRQKGVTIDAAKWSSCAAPTFSRWS